MPKTAQNTPHDVSQRLNIAILASQKRSVLPTPPPDRLFNGVCECKLILRLSMSELHGADYQYSVQVWRFLFLSV